MVASGCALGAVISLARSKRAACSRNQVSDWIRPDEIAARRDSWRFVLRQRAFRRRQGYRSDRLRVRRDRRRSSRRHGSGVHARAGAEPGRALGVGCASARGGDAFLALAPLRPPLAARGRTHARARSHRVRAHTSRARHRHAALSRHAGAMNQPAIHFERREAQQGIEWLRQASAMFRKNPLTWLLLLFTYYLLVGLAEFGPWARIGQIVAPVLKPLFTVGFLAAAWTQERGGAPKFEHLFRGFRSNLFALVPLGIVFLAGITLAVLATILVDGGKLIGMLSGAEKPSE